MRIPLDDIDFLGKFSSYTALVYSGRYFYDIPLDENCRCIISFVMTDQPIAVGLNDKGVQSPASIGKQNLQAHLIIGRNRITQINYQEDPIATIQVSSPDEGYQQIVSIANKFGKKLASLETTK